MANNFAQSFDAREWAQAFVKHVRANPFIAIDEETMVGWFANALMRGYDERRWQTPQYKRQIRHALFPWWNWKHWVATATLLVCALPAFAQTPTPAPTTLPSNVYAAGFSYNAAGAPKVAGDFLYGHLLSDGTGTYSFTFVDILPLKGQPSAVSTSVSTGLAQKVLTLGKAHAYVASGVGIQTDGKNMGWDWNGGVAIDYPIKSGWGVMPTVRFDKGSATEGYGYRFIAGVLVRFAK